MINRTIVHISSENLQWYISTNH